EHLSMKGESASVRQDFMRQALVIEGAELIKPATGTAPAQLVDTPAGQMLVLPGPPHEMQPLLEGFIARYQSVQETSIDLSVFGMNETRVMHVVQPIISDVDGITFTVLASAKECHVILADSGCGHETLASRAQRVEEALGDVVFSHSGETLAEVVVHEAVRQGVTLATAESCTGGLVSGAITSVPGSSDAHSGGIVSYANSVKTGVLGVSPQVLATVGAVSEECAQQMAEGARRALGTTYAVSTTGIAGPGGGTPDKPVGTVCFGLATPTGTRTYRKVWKGGTRADVRARAVSFALDLLRRQLFGLSLERR
ncbi:MAG: nicotinamide-nucleotide amidohydrolase family protein, partial [Coriobacteriales bacterium]|nr:nicotinamide-nucleotide amidohydrolase family protein [Coriobacteriales bacterium]